MLWLPILRGKKDFAPENCGQVGGGGAPPDLAPFSYDPAIKF